MKLLVASTNPGKVREIRGVLEDVAVEIVTPADYPGLEEPEETGATFAENARLKALYYSAATGLPSVADDSGLEVEALGNQPGVQSARWHGRDYAVKFARIYELLAAGGHVTSPARFVAAVAYAVGDEIVFESEGIIEGEIAAEPRGTGGFGYDPIFFYPPLGCTLAELEGAAKSAVSHRGAAFRPFRAFLLESGVARRRAGGAVAD